MPSPTDTPVQPVDVRALVDEIDAALVPLHARRLADLGQDDSGLYDHYRRLLEAGSFYRPADIDRLGWLLNRAAPYDDYVVYRAGLGELAFALALAGRRVTAWEPNRGRREALEAGWAELSRQRPPAGELVVAGRDPESIVGTPAGTAIGLAFELLVLRPGADETDMVRRLLGVNTLLYAPRLFLRSREAETADAEARDLLAGAGFDGFRPGPLGGLSIATRGEVPPIQVRAVPTVPARPRQAPAPEGPCKGLFGIVGSSHCGSTLLNALLGAHPSVAGGGELHWLTRPDRSLFCAICREDCVVWTEARRALAKRENIHDLAAEAFGRPFVCDASKMTEWFGEVQAREHGPPRTTILLAKHPVRQVASYLHKASLDDRKAAFKDPDHVLRVLHAAHNRALTMLEIDVILRYEDLVADPRAEVTKILAGQGLDWDDAIDGWQTAPQHHIGGNRGPRAQMKGAARDDDAWLHSKYERDGIFLDDSWVDTLDEPTFDAVTKNPYAIEICEMFGYEPLQYSTRGEAAPSPLPHPGRGRGGGSARTGEAE